MEHIYLCIDLKSFFASVECAERGLDAMTTNLVVADPDRGRGTICLAITPAMKALGIKNRCRVFQIPEHVKYIMASPRMQLYIDYSANIYAIYLRYISKDDIQVYSIDEAFLDVTKYLDLYRMDAREIGIMIMSDIYNEMHIRATCGIGTNLYLTKIALDITAKHSPDFIGYLDEKKYCATLWNHKPLTDFWRIGPGTARRLGTFGITTMGEIAHTDESMLYKYFGMDAEYLIDHAWGREPTTIAEIKAYKASSNSLSSGQVMLRDYSYDEIIVIVKEMTELLVLDLIDKGLVTDNLSLYIGYSKDTVRGTGGSCTLTSATDSLKILTSKLLEIYESHTFREIPIRRVAISFNNVEDVAYEQYDIFSDPAELEKERKVQCAVLDIKRKYGKGSIIKGMNLLQEGTTMQRNHQIGGHKSGL